MWGENSESVVPSCLPAITIPLPLLLVLVYTGRWLSTTPQYPIFLLLWCRMFAFTLLCNTFEFVPASITRSVPVLPVSRPQSSGYSRHCTRRIQYCRKRCNATLRPHTCFSELEMTLKICRGNTKTNGDTKTDGATHTNWTHISQVMGCSSLYSLWPCCSLSLPPHRSPSLSPYLLLRYQICMATNKPKLHTCI